VHAAVDTLGHLLALRVTPADEQDRAQVGELARQVQLITGEHVELAYVDQGYTGQATEEAAAEHGIRLEVVKHTEAKRGLVLLPRRWVVERSFAWAARFRRLARDYERLATTLGTFHFLALRLPHDRQPLQTTPPQFITASSYHLASLGDNYLMQVQSKGVNATSIDMPNYDGSGYKVNHNPRNGKSYFNTAVFTPNAFGTRGNSKRRMFYGPGIDNYDMALHKVTSFTEGRSLELRLEMFNVFNHAQFYPNGSVDGNIGDASFGRVLRA
jgi:transposase